MQFVTGEGGLSKLKGFDSVAAGLRSSDHNKNIGIYRRLFRGDE